MDQQVHRAPFFHLSHKRGEPRGDLEPQVLRLVQQLLLLVAQYPRVVGGAKLEARR